MNEITINVNEQYECMGDKDISCFILGCIMFDEKLNKFVICKHFQLKKEYAIFEM